MQKVTLGVPGHGRYFCFEALRSADGTSSAAIAELDLLDAAGKSISHQNWRIAYVSSEELAKENGSAENAIDGQTFNAWHSQWSEGGHGYPHILVIDLGKDEEITGFRYVPVADSKNGGKIQDYQIYVGNNIVKKQ